MKNPEADLGGGLTPESVGTLNLRQEVLDGFLSVRQKHNELHATLHVYMREIALPKCREIGMELLAIKSFYPKGKKGSASNFYRDAKGVTALSKPSIANYIQIAENWERLMDYVTDLPEGADPVTSLRGALEAIRAMNRPLKPAASDDAIDVDAEAVEGADQQVLPAGKRTNYAATARKAMETQFTALKAVKVLTPLHHERLGKIQEMLQHLLDDIDRLEGESAVPTTVETTRIDTSNVAIASPRRTGEEDKAAFMAAAHRGARTVSTLQPKGARLSPPPAADEPTTGELPKLADLYPFTQEGLDAMEAAIAEHGSGKALAVHLGNTSSNPARWISDHRRRIKKALES